MVVSKVKVRIDNSDGSYKELNIDMPNELIENIMCEIIQWEELFTASFKVHQDYIKSIDEFNERLKK